MSGCEISFNGKITTRMFDPVKNKLVIKNIRTNKTDDANLITLAHNLVSPYPFKWTRTPLTAEQTKDLDTLLQRIIKKEIPTGNYSRSMLTSDNDFLYMITHHDSILPDQPSPLIKNGIAIDFYA